MSSSSSLPELLQQLPGSTTRPMIQQVIQALQQWMETRNNKKHKQQQWHDWCQHVLHWWHCVPLQQHSLQMGMECFQHSLGPQFFTTTNTTTTTNTVVINDEWMIWMFQTLLRFHDGLIYCTSGECRHRADQQHCQSQPQALSTQLNQISHTHDGYTQLYNPQLHYSGTGWDEWSTPIVGLQARGTQFNPEDWFERIPLLEIALQHLETQLQQLHIQFQECVTLVQQQLLSSSSNNNNNMTHVSFSWQDKWEHVTWRRQHGKTHQLGRRGAEFQVQGPLLPLHCQTRNDWNAILSLSNNNNNKTMTIMESKQPSQTNKKKRRRILDDDDDDDDEEVTPKPTRSSSSRTGTSSQCGKLYRKEQTSSSTTNPNDPASKEDASSTMMISVHALKQQYGFHPHQLEESRQLVEAEEEETRKCAAIEELAQEEEEEETQLSIRDAMARVERRQIVLKRVRQQRDDDDMVWAAREHLRHAAMEAGNVCLWWKDNHQNKKNVYWKDAMEYFGLAEQLVREQQEQLLSSTKDDDDSAQVALLDRNLWLLHGQAVTNRGIAHYFQWNGRRRRHGDAAQRDLQAGIASANQSIALALSSSKNATHKETRMDIWKGLQLKSLACRWLGTQFWHERKWDESMQYFHPAAECYTTYREKTQMAIQEGSTNDKDEEEMKLVLDLKIECYSAWTTVVDLATTVLEKVARHSNDVTAPTIEEGYRVLQLAQEALKQAGQQSPSIRSEMSELHDEDDTRWEAFCADHGVLDRTELAQIQTDLQHWWTQRVKALQQPLAVLPTRRPNYTAGRNDIIDATTPGEEASAPTRRMILQPSQSRKTLRPNTTGGGYSNIGPSLSDVSPPRQQQVSPQFRPWGDQLLPQRVTPEGKSIPILPKPCVAPTLPPELLARAQELGIALPAAARACISQSYDDK